MQTMEENTICKSFGLTVFELPILRITIKTEHIQLCHSHKAVCVCACVRERSKWKYFLLMATSGTLKRFYFPSHCSLLYSRWFVKFSQCDFWVGHITFFLVE